MTAEGAPAGEEPDERVAAKDARSPLGLALKGVALLAVALFLGLLAWATFSPSGGAGLVARIAAGKAPPAPGFDLAVLWPRTETWPREVVSSIADDQLEPVELRGRPVVLNVWASWCIPCREEAPILNASARAHRGEVAFVGVDVQDLKSDALAFLREFNVSYVSVRDRGNVFFERYGLTGVPETYFLAADGRIIAHSPGPVTRETLEDGVRAAVAGTP